jgi:uncharacterized protein involved in outer membrane biogenesis
MRRRLFAGPLVVVGALAGIVVFGVLRQSIVGNAVRAAAEERLSAVMGQRVTIGAVGLSLTPRPAFTGADVRIGAAGEEAPAVRVERVRIVPRLRSFFSDTVRIEEISLDGFAVSLLRDTAGRWRVPAVFPAPSPDARPGVTIERVRIRGGTLRIFDAAEGGAPRQRSSIDDIETELAIDGAGLRLKPLSGRVGAAAIDGEAAVDTRTVRLSFNAPAIDDADLPRLLGLIGAARPEVLRFDERASATVSVTIDRVQSRLTGSGSIRVPSLTVQPLRLQHLDAPFTIAGSRFTFTPATFVVNEGRHQGRVTLAFDSRTAGWSTDSRVERLDVGALLDTLAARDAKIDGAGRVDAMLRGPLQEGFVNRMEGGARLAIENGVLHDFPLLAAINRTLRLAEGDAKDTRFERLSATLDIGGGGATTDNLAIEAGDIRAELAGRIDFDRSLALRGRAFVTRERVARAVASVRELARAKNARGEIELPLVIGGTLDSPQFDIDLATAIRQGVRDEMRRLRGLIRR